jgi:hypothetical protein
MITREDLRETGGSTSETRRISEMRVEDLEYGRPLFGLLRKPDFQRVTANWSADKVADFIRSFLNEEFVPSLIMWESKLNGKLFVIDGAHRLSALMAWVNDDYGSGILSKSFFGEDGITETQKRYAKTTSDAVQLIGTYQDLKRYAQSPERAPNEATLVRARKLFTSKLDLQWVGGDAKTAENSFFKINVSATILDDTELSLLQARRKPNAIATRALIHAGRGHKFWSEFALAEQKQTESLAHDVNEVLFKPILEDPIKTVELPVAGHSYSPHSFQMLLDLVNMVNGISPVMWMQQKTTKKNKSSPLQQIADDADGSVTNRFLMRVKNAALLITGNHKGSLGLHPVVYFYGVTGKFHPAALLAAIKFFTTLEKDSRLVEFAVVRYPFEEFLVKHRHFINELSHSKGSRLRPVESFVAMYEIVLAQVKQDRDVTQIIEALHSDDRLKDLSEIREDDQKYRQKFSRDVKSAAYLRDAIETPVRCAICRARLHSRSMSADHGVKGEDGGQGNPENLRWTHYYCNNSRDAIELKRAKGTTEVAVQE